MKTSSSLLVSLTLLIAASLMPSTSLHASIAALYRFDSSGASQADSSSNGNTATAVNGAAQVFDGTRGSGTMSFDGVDDFLQASDSASLSITSNLTIAMWVNVTAFGGFGQWRGLVTKDPVGSGTAGPYQFWFNQFDGRPNFVGGDGSSNDVAFSNISPSVGGWEHWAVTLTGSTVAMYVNGSPISMVDNFISTSPLSDSNGPLYIGHRDGAQDMSFFGRMDDVAIFDQALTQAEIQTIMTGDFSAFGVAAPEPSRVLLLALGVAGVMLRRRREKMPG